VGRSIYPPLALAAVSHDAAVREVVSGVVSRMQGVVFTGAFGSTAPVIEQAWVSHRNGHRDPWDVLLLDWSLPGAGAAICAQRLSALLRSPRIVALLAGDDPAEALAAARAGAGAVLPRSLTAAELPAQLEPILEMGVSLRAEASR
jgi:DNA-binding NarL/FixJ family response regulator